MRRVYLIRYGLARAVARFAFDPADAPDGAMAGEPLDRGQVVVVRTHRGTELGEVLGEAPGAFDAEDRQSRVAPLLRIAGRAALEQARVAEERRSADFAACQAVFGEGIWPLELIDAEPLLDDRRTVLHYLGPHRLDASGLVAVFRDRCGLDIVLEPVGLDVPDELDAATEPEAADEADDHGCGSCGSTAGGCGSCGSAGGGCAVKALVGNRHRRGANT